MYKNEKRREKGILGVRKSASSQVLPFGRYSDALPSDDSEDSDYAPNSSSSVDDGGSASETNASLSESKRDKKRSSCSLDITTRSPSSVSGSKRRKKISALNEPITSFSRAWSDFIPNEVLLQIFVYCVESQGAVPLLSRLSKVCVRWNVLSKEPKLYRKMDLSRAGKYSIASDHLIKQFIARGLSGVEDISLDGWIKLTDKGVKILVQNCKNLRSICLSNCEGISPKVLSIIAEHCNYLASIDMSGTKIDQGSLRKLLTSRNLNMNEILLRNCKGIPGSAILPMIQEFCPNLLHLDLSGSPVRQIKVELLQECCPKLKTLQLANQWLQPSYSRGTKLGRCNGFPDLEHLSLACDPQTSISIDNSLINRMLKTSCNLRVLDIRGCGRITKDAVRDLCAPSLESIYIANTDAKHMMVDIILLKWRSSLRHLDLGCNPAIRDDTMSLFEKLTIPNLASLDLTSTNVSITGVRNVLRGCPKLEDLNLSSCRGIPRGLKQRHIGERFAQLTNEILSHD